MDIIICGYGKIGSVKADLWHKHGAHVLVYDVSNMYVRKAQKDGFEAFSSFESCKSHISGQPYVIDVSTASGTHVEVLREALVTLGTLPAAIIIEKPIISSQEELADLLTLLNQYGSLLDNTFVNESYYVSKGLAELKLQIDVETENDKSFLIGLEINFHKNRIHDVQSGRFVDKYLGAYGIELPHMLACLQSLGIETLRPQINSYFKEVDGILFNEGTALTFNNKGMQVLLKQSLGRFSFTASGINRTSKVSTPRREILATFSSGITLQLNFDPLEHCPRFHSKIVSKVRNHVVNEKILKDNHMSELLFSVLQFALTGQRPQCDLISIKNSINQARLLMVLSKNATIEHDYMLEKRHTVLASAGA